jgi:hypothetical protein
MTDRLLVGLMEDYCAFHIVGVDVGSRMVTYDVRIVQQFATGEVPKEVAAVIAALQPMVGSHDVRSALGLEGKEPPL